MGEGSCGKTMKPTLLSLRCVVSSQSLHCFDKYFILILRLEEIKLLALALAFNII